MPGRPRPPTPQKLQALAAEIIAMETRSDAQRTARAGRRVLDVVYSADVADFQSKYPNRAPSIATVARLIGRPGVTRTEVGIG